MIFLLQCVNVIYHMIDLWVLTPTCIPGINLTSSWCLILSTVIEFHLLIFVEDFQISSGITTL